MSMRRSIALSREKTPRNTPAEGNESRSVGGKGAGNWLVFTEKESGNKEGDAVNDGGAVEV
jgi:hypothetical protein